MHQLKDCGSADGPLKWISCQRGMARPRVADGRLA